MTVAVQYILFCLVLKRIYNILALNCGLINLPALCMSCNTVLSMIYIRIPSGIKVCVQYVYVCTSDGEVGLCMSFSTCVWVYTECGHRGVFMHEAVCDPAIGALVSIHSMDLQNERPCWLVLQDRGALSVLLTLRRRRM